jgi:sporulation protein YlmC with PRC-barrel domain
MGMIEPARSLIGREIQSAQNENVGKLQDVVVDLESGRVLYTTVAVAGGNRVGVPAELFSDRGGNQPLILNVDKQKLMAAPQFSQQSESNLGNVDFASNVYQYFGQSAWWEGTGQATGKTFGNVHQATQLSGMTVKDSSGQDLGRIDTVAISLPDARVPFALLTTQTSGAQTVYPVPPNALTAGSDQKTLITGIDSQKLQAAPHIARNNLRQLSDPAFAASIYEYYGKQPYWNASQLSPTGH